MDLFQFAEDEVVHKMCTASADSRRPYTAKIGQPTDLYLTYLEIALSNKRRSKKNMADLNAIGGGSKWVFVVQTPWNIT